VILGVSLEGLHQQLLDSNLDPKEIEKAKQGQKQDFPTGIPECGTDALRFALCAYMTQARDINLDILRVQGYRFFCNKLWNAVKFALLYFEGDAKYDVLGQLTGEESNIDLWILSRLSYTIEAANRGFNQYEFAYITNAIYQFWLYDLCDVYLECLKPVFHSGTDTQKLAARRTLYTCLDYGLRLLSPFMPFITEELFQRLPRANTTLPSICIAEYPTESTSPGRCENIEKDVDFLQKTIKVIRSARSDYNLPNKTRTEAYIVSSSDEIKATLRRFAGDLATLSYCSKVELDAAPPAGCAILTVTGHCEVHLLLKGLIDPEKEKDKLQKKKDQLEQSIKTLEKAMSAADYGSKVPFEVQTANVEKKALAEDEIQRIIAALQLLSTM